MQNSFLFLFLFPLFLPFLLLFSFFLFFSFLPFSFPFLPFSSSFLPFSFPFLLILFVAPPCIEFFVPPRTEFAAPPPPPSNLIFIGLNMAMLDDTWHAMCHTHGLPCATHMACHVSYMHRPFPCNVTHGLPCVTHIVFHVSPTWLATCRPTSVVSKYMKF